MTMECWSTTQHAQPDLVTGYWLPALLYLLHSLVCVLEINIHSCYEFDEMPYV